MCVCAEFDALISQFVTEASKNCIARPVSCYPATSYTTSRLLPAPRVAPATPTTIWHRCCRTSVAGCLTFCVCTDMRAHKFETGGEQQLETEPEPELELELNNCHKICYTFLQPHNKCQLPLPP